MSAVKVVPSRGGGLSTIPANARKVVQDLKEIVRNSDEEIYAMLKECDMDPNEAVQRLINQDTFREVKRKRDRKKENMSNKEPGDVRPRPAGSGLSVRGGRVPDRGAGRGNFVPRYNSGDLTGRRGQQHPVSENSICPIVRTPCTASTPLSESHFQLKSSSTGMSAAVVALVIPNSGGISNGSASYTSPSQRPRPTWSPCSNHFTMPEIAKSSSPSQPVFSAPSAVVHTVSTSAPAPQQDIPSASNIPDSAHLSSRDPVPRSFLESRASASVSSTEWEVDKHEKQRSSAVQGQSLSLGMGLTTSSSLPLNQASQTNVEALHVSNSNTKVTVTVAATSSISVSSSILQEQGAKQTLAVDAGSVMETEEQLPSSSVGITGSAVVKSTVISNQFNGRAMYHPQQQSVGTQKVGSGLEWKPKPLAQNATLSQTAAGTPSVNSSTRLSPPPLPQEDAGLLSTATSKLQGLTIQGDQPVIIPDHFQVADADRMHLSFGSFGADFGSNFSTKFSSEGDDKSLASVEVTSQAETAPIEKPVTPILTEKPVATSSSNSTPETPGQDHSHQLTSSPVESIVSSNVTLISMPVHSTSHPEILKTEPIVQQSPQFSYLQTSPKYPALGLVPQVAGGQYVFEPAELQPQEVSRLQSFAQPYSDPTRFYNPVFRTTSDGEVRYSQFFLTNAASKYSGNTTLMSGQSFSSSQEGVNSVVPSAAVPTGQTSQTVGIAQATLTMPQQPLPIHAYPGQPAGVPISPFAANVFGYQYVPPSYTYMHSPYQHNYTGNANYTQRPTVSNYAPAAGSAYPTAAGAAIKYTLPQFKPATGGGAHAAVAAGYGSYTPAPGLAVSPAVTAGSASGYDEADGSAVWIHAHLSRDMTGLQANSYYNIPAQGHHTGYTHTPPTHAHPAAAYASLYHPSQSGSVGSAHHLLQQQQTLGTVGAGSVQAGTYQQAQRTQLNWTSSY
eukprot:c28270_g1_i1 orf=714-3578(-)